MYNEEVINNTTNERQKMAVEILAASHPLNATFVNWLGGKEATKRQARKFLQAHPWAAKALEQSKND